MLPVKQYLQSSETRLHHHSVLPCSYIIQLLYQAFSLSFLHALESNLVRNWFCFKIANLFLLSLLYSSSFDDHSRHVYILYYNLQYILYLISSSSSIFVFLVGSENKTWKFPSCRLSWIPHCPRVGRVIPSMWLFNNPSERWRSWNEWVNGETRTFLFAIVMD